MFIQLNLLFILYVPISVVGFVTEDQSVECEIDKVGLTSDSETYVETISLEGSTAEILNNHEGIIISEEGSRFPLRKGLSFGFSYTFSGLKEGEKVKQVITHPEILKPNGEISNGYERWKKPGIGAGYEIEFDYEVVPGIWKFEYFHKGKLLCEQQFELY